MTPTVINSLIHLDISEIIRIIVSNGMIVYALTRKMGGKKVCVSELQPPTLMVLEKSGFRP